MKKIAAIILLPVLLAGCANTSSTRKIEGQVQEDAIRASKQAEEARKAEVQLNSLRPLVHVKSGIYLGGKSIKLDQSQTLPPVFQTKVSITRRLSSLTELAERITGLTQLRVVVSQDALVKSGAVAGTSVVAPAGQPILPTVTSSGSPPVPIPATTVPSAVGANNRASTSNEPVLVSYEGDLSGLLDTVASRYGLSWRFENGVIKLFYMESKTYYVSAFPGISDVNTTIGQSNSGGSSSTGGSAPVTADQQNAKYSMALDIHGDMVKSIEKMLTKGEGGLPSGQVQGAPSMGSITVTDTPEVHARISQYMESQDRTMRKQVAVTVQVLSVSLADGEQFGINWNVVFNSLSKKYGFNLSNTVSADAAAGSISGKVLSTATGDLGQFAGTEAVLKALQTQGSVRVLRTATQTTLNNQVVPVRVGTSLVYLASSQTTITPNVGASTTLTPGTIMTGFTMQLLPHVLQDNTVQLQTSIDMTTLKSLKTVASSSSASASTIQAPEIDSTTLMNRAELPSGGTLILSGFEQQNDYVNRSGTLAPDNYLLGGGHSASSKRDIIVVLVTPRLIGK